MRLLAVLALGVFNLPAQSLSELADAQIQAADIRGSILLAKNGKILLAKSYGLANAEHDVPNTPETKFRLASITKQFTGAAILKLQEMGKLSVQDKISQYIPAAPSAWSAITIHQLLSHTSGIPSYTGRANDESERQKPAAPPLDFINQFKNLPLHSKPGEEFTYNNSGYFLLGLIIEQASGQSYEDFLRTHIFQPLGMMDTGYDHSETILKNRAAGYVNNKNAAYINMDYPYAAGALYSTVLDLFKWDQALRSSGFLTAASLRAAFTPNLLEWAPGIQYGYGWGISIINGKKTAGHGGGINGFSTIIWRAVDEPAVVVILSNNEDSPRIAETGKALMTLLLD